MTTCNGWTNYATWRVYLEMLDDINPIEMEWPTDDSYSLSKVLKEFCEDSICGDDAGIAEAFALAFMSDVNWLEIAEHMIANYAEA